MSGTIPLQDRVWVTLAEAQSLTGMSRYLLRRAMDTAGIQPRKPGGRTLYVRRADLDRIWDALPEADEVSA